MPIEYKEVGVLAVPNLKISMGVPNFITILEKIRPAGYKQAGREKPNDVALVTDLEHSDPKAKFQMIIPAIAKIELEKKYPKGEYVGRSFRITRWAKSDGKTASPVDLVEIEVKGGK